MPYLPTAQSFLQNSTLLLSARPTTTRITTKYTILSAKSDSKSATKKILSVAPSSRTKHPPMKAVLVLKTYDPVSGTCLKYRTDKAAEVGRLIAALGTCGRVMAALPEKAEVREVKEEESQRDKEVEDKAVDAKGKPGGPGTQSGKGLDKDGKGKAGGGTGGGAGRKKKGKR